MDLQQQHYHHHQPHNPELYHQQQVQQELNNWQDKYDRILNAHEKLQRLNASLEEKLLKIAEDQQEKETNEINRVEELTQRLVEARVTIHQLEDENERYKNDITVIIKLLQCKPSNFISHTKIDTLPEDLQKKVLGYKNGTERREKKIIKVQVPTNSTSADLCYSVDKGLKGRRNVDPNSDIVSAAILARVFEERESERRSESAKLRCKCSSKIPLPTLSRETQTNSTCTIINYSDFIFPDDHIVPPLFPLPLHPSTATTTSTTTQQQHQQQQQFHHFQHPMSRMKSSMSHPSLRTIASSTSTSNKSSQDLEDDLLPRLEKAFSQFNNHNNNNNSNNNNVNNNKYTSSSSSLSSPSSLSNNSFASISGVSDSSNGGCGKNVNLKLIERERRLAGHCVRVIDEKDESHWRSTVLVHHQHQASPPGISSTSANGLQLYPYTHHLPQDLQQVEEQIEEIESSSGIGSINGSGSNLSCTENGNSSPTRICTPNNPEPESDLSLQMQIQQIEDSQDEQIYNSSKTTTRICTSSSGSGSNSISKPKGQMVITTNEACLHDEYSDILPQLQQLQATTTLGGGRKRNFWTKSNSTTSTETEI